MDRDDDPSTLAWLWTIEALSACKQITAPTLQGFIDVAPVGHNKFSKITKELVALRCLEELSSHVVDPEASSLNSRVPFDFSWDCDDVLQQILGKEIPLSNLKMVGAKLLKWDVGPFIKHKRADTFKCHLEQLREAILEGSHPHGDYLKEKSGVFSGSTSYADKSVPIDNKRSRNSAEMKDCVNDNDDFSRTSKKMKSHTPLADFVYKDVVQPVVPEYHPVMTTTIMPQHTFVAEPCNDTSMDVTDNTAHHAIPKNDANAEKNQHIINLHQPKQTEPDITSLNLFQKAVASDKTIVDMVNGCGAELSSDSDGYHNEENYHEAKNHEFLRSHCTVDKDFSALTESIEENLCMNCNEGGQLLACKSTSCPLMVHKNCLGAYAQLDAKGNCFCLFCESSHAISEYREAKKNSSLELKEFAIFISKLNQAAELVHEFHRQEHCFSRKSSKCEHIHGKNNEDDHLTGCEGNREDHVGEQANEANNLQMDANLGDEFTSEKTNTAPPNRSNAGEEVQEMTKQHGKIVPVCAHDTEKNEISEDGCKNSIPIYSLRFPKHDRQCEPQPSPVFPGQLLRRKKNPWTAEEEEVIKEGVQRFGLSDPRKWIKILQFGSHVFDKASKRRTPQDLKDKWRNMCKAQSKS